MAVAAGVIGDLVAPTTFTAQHMSPQRRAAALLDGRHDLELAQAQVPTLSLAPSGPMDREDVGDLQGGPPHDGALRRGQDLDRRQPLCAESRCRSVYRVPSFPTSCARAGPG